MLMQLGSGQSTANFFHNESRCMNKKIVLICVLPFLSDKGSSFKIATFPASLILFLVQRHFYSFFISISIKEQPKSRQSPNHNPVCVWWKNFTPNYFISTQEKNDMNNANYDKLIVFSKVTNEFVLVNETLSAACGKSRTLINNFTDFSEIIARQLCTGSHILGKNNLNKWTRPSQCSRYFIW